MSHSREQAPGELPPRLLDRGDGDADSEASALLKKFVRHAPQYPPEEAVWNRTLARLVREGPRHRFRLVAAMSVGVVLGVLGTGAFLRFGPEGRGLASRAPEGVTPVAHTAAPAGVRVDQPPGASHSGASPSVSPAPLPPSSPVAALPAGSPVRIQLTSAAVALPHGPAELAGEAEVELSRDGKAFAVAEQQAAVVELNAGAINVHVEKRTVATSRRFDVRAGGYRFTVLGTRFEVSKDQAGVRLSVSEGRVGVFRDERRVAVVTAGGAWSSATVGVKETIPGREEPGVVPPPAVPAAAPAGAPPSPVAAAPEAGPREAEPTASVAAAPLAAEPPPAVVPPPVEPPPLPPTTLPSGPPPSLAAPPRHAAPASSCVPAARGDVRQLLACYLDEARGTGLTAEVALYEAARLRLYNLTDLPGALDLLREHRRRFPDGTLTFEVRLSMAELLPKLGRYRDALTDIDGLLEGNTGGERRGELLLLRGHVLREGFQDWAAAERAYARAAEARDREGRAADPAAFWRAVCLESLGRKDEARRAYAAYLARPRPSLREQAELRLRALEREHSGRGAAPSR